MAFGPHGTREGEAWRKPLVSVSATPARVHNVEADVPPILGTKKKMWVMPARYGELSRLIKNIQGL